LIIWRAGCATGTTVARALAANPGDTEKLRAAAETLGVS
jgi:hypothetical protein